jgi:hypothetical protein
VLGVIVQQSNPAPSVFLEIFAGVAVLGVGSFFAFIVRRFKTIDAVYEVMATRKPSELEPHPPKGLIDQVRDVIVATGENTNAVLTMSVRQQQANGTMKKMQTAIDSIQVTVEKMAGRPPASVAEVKKAVADEHEASEARQAEILGAIQQDTTALVKDMHTDGGDSSRDVLDEQSRVLHDISDEQGRVKEERLKDDEGA